MASPELIVDLSGQVAVLTLSRPEAGNVITERLAEDLAEACGEVMRRDSVRVVVLTGAGGVFCRGTSTMDEPAPLALFNPDALARLRVAEGVAAIGKPVVAALEGDALGQGLELALACDIRVAARGARLALTQVREGMLPWDGGTQRLPRLVGPGRARELALTGRAVSAREALQMGLVNRVVARGAACGAATKLAALIASHGPVACAYLKEAINQGMDLALPQGLRLEADLSFLLHTTADRAEGIRSFLERRRPTFRGD